MERNFKLISINKDKLPEYVKDKTVKTCTKCGVVKTTDNTKLIRRHNNAKGFRLDNLCYQCRLKEQQYYNELKQRGEYQAIDPTSAPSLKSKWRKKMVDNPIYFTHIFHCPATPENIAREAARLGM